MYIYNYSRHNIINNKIAKKIVQTVVKAKITTITNKRMCRIDKPIISKIYEI